MKHFTRRQFLASSALPLAAAPPKRPNILFIMVDEMRWDALGVENHPVVKTPNLDKLASQSVRFTNAYTVSPVCCPARASVFTGRYAHVHGVTTNGVPANNGEIFLPSILKHYGYHTAISGKLHYTPARFDYGFDQFWSFASEGPTPEFGYQAFLKKKHGSPAKWARVDGTCPWPEDPLGHDVGLFKYPEEDFETDWITARSVEYLRSRKSANQPWFLFTSYLKPHSPSVEPQPYFDMYDPSQMPIPPLPPNAKAIRAAKVGQAKRHYVDNEEMMRVMSAKYFGAITHVDFHVGKLLAELDTLGFADNTIVLFTADHGNMLGDHGRWFKGVQYEGSSHVPLLWRGLGQSAGRAGKIVPKVIENTDLAPTLLEASGLPIPEGMQGKSFVKLARGNDPKWKDCCFSQLNAGMMVRDGYKLIDNSLDGTGPWELYNLSGDRKEQNNLIDNNEQQVRVKSLKRELAGYRAAHPPPVKIAGMKMPAYASITDEERANAVRNAPGEDAPAGNEPQLKRKK